MGKSVRDTMTSQPTSIDSSQSIVDAARMMREEDVGSLPVTDQGRLIGVITDRDIVVRIVAEARADSASVADALSRNPITVTPDHDLDDALKLMARHQVRRIPVVEDDRLVGIVSQADVALNAREKKTGELVESISER